MFRIKFLMPLWIRQMVIASGRWRRPHVRMKIDFTSLSAVSAGLRLHCAADLWRHRLM